MVKNSDARPKLMPRKNSELTIRKKPNLGKNRTNERKSQDRESLEFSAFENGEDTLKDSDKNLQEAKSAIEFVANLCGYKHPESR